MPNAARQLYENELLHRVLPWQVGARVATSFARRAWEREPRLRDEARLHMRFLVGRTARASEVEELAERYVIQCYLRRERWFRPWLSTRDLPDGFDGLRSVVGAGRGVVVSFMHHGDFHGAIGSLGRGLQPHVVVHSAFFDPGLGRLEGQVIRTLTWRGGQVFGAKGSSARISALLSQGELVVAACDVPGSFETTLFGRTLRVASGITRLAVEHDALIVPLTLHPHGTRQRGVLGEPIDSRDFASPADLLSAVLQRHESSVMEWPEAFERPLRILAPAGADLDEFGWAQTATLRI